MKKGNAPLFAWIAFCLLFFGAVPVRAVGTNALITSGNWDVGANWSSGFAPGITGTSGTSGVSSVATIGSGLTVSLPEGVSGTANTLDVGYRSSGGANISGGSLNLTSLSIGSGTNSNGTMAVSAGSLKVSSEITVGDSGTGALNISGGLVSAYSVSIGSGARSLGGIVVSGGTLTTVGNLVVGYSGTGTLTVENSGAVVSTGTLVLAQAEGSVGILNYTGGNLSVSSVAVGSGSATVNFTNTDDTNFAAKLEGRLEIKKSGTGTMVISSTSTNTGPTTVSEGTLKVDGSLPAESAVTVARGATLSGTGSVNGKVTINGTLAGTLVTGIVNGSGLVSPGNSPGILTSPSVDVSGGLDFAFEFTLANTAPHYSNAIASGNDIQLLTSATPFVGTFTLGNTISIYLGTIHAGDTFLGGFFTSLSAAALQAAVGSADLEYYVLDADGDITFNGNQYSKLDASNVLLEAVDVTDATFSNGTTTGSELKLTVSSVPEPQAWALLAGGAGLLWAFRQKLRGFLS